MKASLAAIRSIGVEFANRVYRTVALITLAVAIGSVGITYWLTTLSNWWWLLFMPLIILLSAAAGVLAVVKLVIRSVTPVQTRAQKKQAKAFVDKLQRVAEVTQTPKFILLFQIVRDIAAPRESGFIAALSHDTALLKRDFAALRDAFK